MNGNARIRRAQSSDAAAIVALERLFPGDRMSAASVRRLLRVATAEVWVAAREARLVGALVLLFRKNSARARIYSLVVAPEARGTGLGARLIQRAEHSARVRNCQGMTLEVRQENAAARHLYRKLGYDERRVLPDYYDDGAIGLRLERTFTRGLKRTR